MSGSGAAALVAVGGFAGAVQVAVMGRFGDRIGSIEAVAFSALEGELVDYLRIDMVHAGGITEAKKILAAGEMHGQRSALHHASSPVDGTACLHVDMAVPNFGIQEWMELEPLYELFPNAPRAHADYVSPPPPGPGLSLDFDEAEACRRPSRDTRLPQRYWPDSSVGDY